jgi:1-deoxy-D-xylulose-5-phosphate reductoisomerase
MAVLNAANEVSVDAFLRGKIGFMDIPHINHAVLVRQAIYPVEDIETVVTADQQARASAQDLIERHVQ